MLHRGAGAGLVAAAVKARLLGHLEKEEEKKLVTQASGLQHDLVEQRTKQFHQMEQALGAEQSSLQVSCLCHAFGQSVGRVVKGDDTHCRPSKLLTERFSFPCTIESVCVPGQSNAASELSSTRW